METWLPLIPLKNPDQCPNHNVGNAFGYCFLYETSLGTKWRPGGYF